MKIKFVSDWRVKQGDGKGPRYETGKEYVFEGMVAETYAKKYIARGLAVVAVDGPTVLDRATLRPPEPKKAEIKSGMLRAGPRV